VADHEDLNGPQLAHRCAEFEVCEDPTDMLLQDLFEITGLGAGEGDGADTGHRDLPLSVHREAEGEIHRTPYFDVDFIARPRNIIGRDRDVGEAGEAAPVEKAVAKERNVLAGGFLDEALELGGAQGGEGGVVGSGDGRG
jgi:hypothetical protein